MDSVEVTWGRATKILWSFMWRAMVLSVLILFPLEGVMMFFVISYIPRPGQPPNPQQAMKMAATMMVLWPFVMAAIFGVQVIAMRWMLRATKWSDFRLTLLPPEQR
jgi:heme/copper-type cytochrome/quinol oxidase subunit 2